MTDKSFRFKRFRHVGFLTVAAVYFLILVGGIVRSTGSGMGCPDWPKCFGSWVPPTHVSQLPDDHLEVYKEQRIAKNQRVAGTLERLGYHQLAAEIFAHPGSFVETEFNVTKTWIEYVNRLLGALVGILIFLTLVFSRTYWQKDRAIVWLSLFSFLLVGFQGWLGSLVVSTNLLPEMVTVHMALALVLVAVLIYALARAEAPKMARQVIPERKGMYLLLVLALVLTFVQIVLGTQVREQVDIISANLNYQMRDTWVDQLGLSFYIHRSFSVLMLVVNVWLLLQVMRTGNRLYAWQAQWMMGVVLVEIVVGVIMAYFGIPALLQPIHLLLATLIFGLQMGMFITYYYASRSVSIKPVPLVSKV